MSNSDQERKQREEFLAEAQEVVETFGRILLELDASTRAEQPLQPDDVNAAFRAIHTLKGLCSIFGQQEIAQLSHDLEEVLDAMRLGRIVIDAPLLDLLFESVEVLQLLMAGDSADTETRVKALREGMAGLAGAPSKALVALDDELLRVLTEYEEHRLRESVGQGLHLFMIRGEFDIENIDSGLQSLRSRLKKLGEVITCLPSEDDIGEDRLALDLLLATDRAADEIQGVARSLGTTAAVPVDVSAGFDDEPEAAPTGIAPVPLSPGRAEPVDVAPRESLRSLSQTVRVNIEKLDRLMNSVGDLTLVRNDLLDLWRQTKERPGAKIGPEFVRRFTNQLKVFQRRLDELRTGILEVRMVPLSYIFDKLARVVRKLSREFGKEIAFYVSGGDTEIDKLIVEELSDPLMHIIRNCIDHGVESVEERIAVGKQAEGMVALRAYARGNHVVIEVEDDGAGINPEKVIKTAIARGFVGEDEADELSDRDALNFIFSPGFTTRATAGALSGRGVGMDVVKTNLARLSGLIDVHSEVGQGTRFTLTLPITLAIIRSLIVRIANQVFAIPLNTVLEIFGIADGQISTIERREVVNLRGTTLPLVRLQHRFGLAAPEADMSSLSPSTDDVAEFVVVVGMAQHRMGLVVDELLDQQDIVIKPLGRALADVPGIAGATELGGRKTVLVLDVASLVETSISL